MPFTSKLGTSDSQLNNIVAGLNGGAYFPSVTSILGIDLSQFGNIAFGVGSLGNEVPSLPQQFVGSNLVLTQTVTLNKILNLSASNTITFAESAGQVFPQAIGSTIAFSHNVTYLYGKFVYPTNTLAFTQIVSAQKIILRTVNQNLVLTHSATRNIVKGCVTSNVFNVTQLVVATNTKFTSNTLVFTQTATYFVAKTAKNTIEYTQTMSVQLTLNKHVFDFFGIGHQAITGPNTFRRSLTSVLSFTQAVLGFAVKGVTHTLALTQAVIVHKVKGTQSTANFTQSAVVVANYQRSVTDLLLLRHSVFVNKIKGLSAQSIFAPIQSVKKTRIRTASASSVFGVTHELVKSRYIRDLSQNLVLTHGVVHQRTALPSVPVHNPGFTHSVKLNKVLNLHCGNQLVFKNSFQRRVTIGNQTIVIVPEAQVIKVKNLVILRGADLAITLPAPEFDDSEAYTGSVNIIRFKTGSKIVYKNDTEKSVLSYTFAIERNKKNELKYFIKQYNSTPFYLENWKGEIWYVMFNNNPFVITEEKYWADMPIIGGNKFSVPLSFEGVRLN